MRVRPYERQAGIAPLPQSQAIPTPPAGDFGFAAGKIVGDIAGRLQKINNDTEDARTLELFNQFKQDSANYHDDPDKGIYNTRLGFQARGLFQDADQWLRSKGEEYVRRLDSNRAKDNFRKMAAEHIQQQGVANSRFEAAQTRQYQQQQADATIKNGLNDIALNPYDDDSVETIRQNMTAALELKHRYSSQEERREALRNLDSDIAVSRLNTMLKDNPLKAEEWFNKHKELFNAQAALHYGEAVKNATDTFKIQSAVDELVKVFPQGNEQDALKWIRQNFSGEIEERVVSAYKTRANELALDLNRDNRLRKLQQDELHDKILTDFYLHGVLPPDSMLKELVAEGKLRYEQAENIQSRGNVSLTRSRFEREILASNPDLSPLELDNEVMRRMGVSDEEYKRTFAAAAQAVMTGQADSNTLDYLYQRGRLTRNDVEQLKKRAKGLDDVQKNYYRAETQELNNTLKQLVDAGLPQELVQGIRDRFAAGETLLEPKSKSYREDLLRLKKQILIDAIDQSGERLNGYLWGKTSLGELYQNIQDETLQARGIDPFPTLPDISPSPISLSGAQSSAAASGNPVLNMVKGYSIPNGGGFSAARGYRKGTHHGLDLSAPEGTEIFMRDFGTPLTVSNVNTATPSKGAGNSVTLKGKYPSGDIIEITLGHMGSNTINVDTGQVVHAGTLIGKVGNSGMTSENGKITPWREDKKTGFHLDVKIKINGDYVDPATFDPTKYMGNTTAKITPQEIFTIPDYKDL